MLHQHAVFFLGGGVWGGCVFFFNDTATTEIYTLSLHDALPISSIEDLNGLLLHAAPGTCPVDTMISFSFMLLKGSILIITRGRFSQ